MGTPMGILTGISMGILNGCHGFTRDGYASPVTHPSPTDGYRFPPTTHPWVKINAFTHGLWVFSRPLPSLCQAMQNGVSPDFNAYDNTASYV